MYSGVWLQEKIVVLVHIVKYCTKFSICLLQGASDYVIQNQNWKKYIFMILFTSGSGTTVLLVKETLRGAAIFFKNVSKVEQYILRWHTITNNCKLSRSALELG